MIPLYTCFSLFIGVAGLLSHKGYFIHHEVFSIKTYYVRPYLGLTPFYPNQPRTVAFSTSPRQVSIHELLTNARDYHEQLVSLRGMISQPELHLDDTELYLDFVFRLVDEMRFIIVYGRHDRTISAPAIRMNQQVEVIGWFFKEQERNGVLLENVLEAISVTSYPSSLPEST